jgi:hypothetical protein
VIAVGFSLRYRQEKAEFMSPCEHKATWLALRVRNRNVLYLILNNSQFKTKKFKGHYSERFKSKTYIINNIDLM